MSRLFGVMCNEPEHLKCALVDAREALVAEGAPDGWGLAFFQGRYTSGTALLAAGATLVALPVVVVYLILQRHFIRGMVEGAVK